MKDLGGRYLFVNRRFEERFGLSRGSALGKTNADLFPQDVADALTLHERRVIESGSSHEGEDTIAIGDEADEQTLAAMASSGKGQFYAVNNPSLLPRFLLKAVRVAWREVLWGLDGEAPRIWAM